MKSVKKNTPLTPKLSPITQQEQAQQLRQSIEAELSAELERTLRPLLKAEIEQRLNTEFQQKLEQHIQQIEHDKNQPDIQSSTLKPDQAIKNSVEAILFAADKPLSSKQIQMIYPELERPELKQVQAAIDSIAYDYRLRPIELKQLASGYRFQVRVRYADRVAKLFAEKPTKYSRALLETLAIIAYRQPVTRGDIEDIRGVSVSSNIIRTLLEREWIRIIAHKEVPGRPALYGTTKQFLNYFNLSSMDQLPSMEAIKDLDFSSLPTYLQSNENHNEPYSN